MENNQSMEALLAEFTALRAESSALAQSEDSLATTIFSFIAAVIGLNFLFSGQEQANIHSSQVMVLGLCPLIIMFFGCMWMNILYRRIRYGVYLYLLEVDINKCIVGKKKKIYWEHWLIAIESDRKFFTRTSRFWGYIIFGSWLSMPVLLYVFAAVLFPTWDICAFLIENIVWTCIIGITAIVYYIIMICFCREILCLRNPKKLTQLNRIQ